jgi:ATPase subunit of ABC transporter with duplicated ATPase domains
MDVLELSKKVDEIEAKFDLGSVSALLRDEFAITPTKELEKVLKELEKNERELKIGVIGRVKAGKSTLLNGVIFDGENVLPKAATPMTASLTILEYSDNDEVVVEFFSDDDLRDLKREHNEYSSAHSVQDPLPSLSF